MQSYQGDVIESRLDYLTLTSSKETDRLLLEMRAKQLLRAETIRGDDGRAWSWFGYTGAATRNIQYGQRVDSDILRLSGSIADEAFQTTAPLASHVTRIDLAVTVRLPGVTDDYLQELWERARCYHSPTGRTPRFDLHRSSEGGSTLYIGSRNSRHFARIYNKHAQSELAFYADCFRYEVEAKGSLAPHLAHAVASSADRSSACRSYVHNFLRERGLQPTFSECPEQLRVAPYRRRPDDTSRLAWCAAQVRPALDVLRRSGLEREAYTALGIE